MGINSASDPWRELCLAISSGGEKTRQMKQNGLVHTPTASNLRPTTWVSVDAPEMLDGQDHY